MAKQEGRGTPNYDKWKASGYLDGIDEATGTVIADLLELGEVAFTLQPDFNSNIVSTGQGNIEFPKDDLLYEAIVDVFLKKNDQSLTIDYNDIYSEIKTAISQRGVKMFDADQKAGDGQPYFDPVNLYCFREWFANYYANKNGKGR